MYLIFYFYFAGNSMICDRFWQNDCIGSEETFVYSKVNQSNLAAHFCLY